MRRRPASSAAHPSRADNAPPPHNRGTARQNRRCRRPSLPSILRGGSTGSSSAPARKVSTIAPVPERKVTHDSCVPSTAPPIAAPMISCAIVPTTISDSAVATRSHMDSSVADRARGQARAQRVPNNESWCLSRPSDRSRPIHSERTRTCRALRDRSHQPVRRLTGNSIPLGSGDREVISSDEALPPQFRSYKPPVKC